MIRFTGSKLEQSEMRLLRSVAQFTLDKFLTRSVQQKLKITIEIDDEYEGGSGECCYVGVVNGVKTFEVVINEKKIKRNANNPFVRLKNPIETIIHEMIHVKQYATNELFDYVNGDSRYRGDIYTEVDYWDSPWEIEAYGRTEGIFRKFVEQYKGMKKK